MVTSKTVVFVCEHGALKSRLAAAMFSAAAPAGWQATSAGLHPQATVSVHAAALLAGTNAAKLLDLDSPKPLIEIGQPDRLITIDCVIDGATAWRLAHGEPDATMRDELRDRVADLAREIADDHR